MPNLYATPTEIKAAIPDGIRAATTKYDALILRLANEVARYIDRHCGRPLYPFYGPRYFAGLRQSPRELWIDPCLEIESVAYSTDGGQSYTALTSADYIETVGGDRNALGAITMLAPARGGALAQWPTGPDAVKVTGFWGASDARAGAFESVGDTVQAPGLTDGGGSLVVGNAAGADLWGISPRIQPGHLLRLGNELTEATTVATNTVTILRARNGSAGAAHVAGVAVYVWRPPEPVKQAAIIQAVKQMERGFQGFGDARAAPDQAQIFWVKEIDPEAQAKLSFYKKMAVG